MGSAFKIDVHIHDIFNINGGLPIPDAHRHTRDQRPTWPRTGGMVMVNDYHPGGEGAMGHVHDHPPGGVALGTKKHHQDESVRS